MKKFDPILATLWALLGVGLITWSLFDAGPKGDLHMTWGLAALIIGRVTAIHAELDRWRKL